MPSKLSHQNFIEKVKKNNESYRKGLFEINSQYICAHCDVELKNDYGVYIVKANDLMKGTTNPSIKNVIEKEKYLLKKFSEIHNNKYKYNNLVYRGYKSKIDIQCPAHENFKQTIDNHINGAGCPHCAGNTNSFKKVVQKANKIHNNKYKYPLQKYINNKSLFNITCPIHGEFKQVVGYHLSGCGCPKCGDEGRKNNKGGFSELPTHAKAMGWASGFNGCAT